MLRVFELGRGTAYLATGFQEVLRVQGLAAVVALIAPGVGIRTVRGRCPRYTCQGETVGSSGSTGGAWCRCRYSLFRISS